MSVEGESLTNANSDSTNTIEKKLVYPDEEVAIFNKEKIKEFPENSPENQATRKLK